MCVQSAARCNPRVWLCGFLERARFGEVFSGGSELTTFFDKEAGTRNSLRAPYRGPGLQALVAEPERDDNNCAIVPPSGWQLRQPNAASLVSGHAAICSTSQALRIPRLTQVRPHNCLLTHR